MMMFHCSARSAAYGYDQTNQLISADHSDADNPDETYAYDKNGNRTHSSQHGDDYVTGTNNQLETDGVYNYAYDDQGNMIRQEAISTGKIRSFAWDYRNRLVAVIDETAGVETQRVEYVYDVMGRRIAKTVDADGAGSGEATTTHFVYDGDDVLLEFVGQDATPTQRYLHGPQIDQVLAQDDHTGQTLWLLSDHLGTVKDLVDETGTVLNHRTYDSYGNLTGQSDAAFSSRYGFTGRELDEETGLYYYRARYYNADIGRFISQDPISFSGGDSNLYRYAANSPVIASDPSGLETVIYVHDSWPGHASIDIDGTVYTYGRYGNNNPTTSRGAIGDGILYMIPRDEYLRPNNIFRNEDVTIQRWNIDLSDSEEATIQEFFEDLFYNGTPQTEVELDNGTRYVGVDVANDRYILLGNNCTTITIDSLPPSLQDLLGGLIAPFQLANQLDILDGFQGKIPLQGPIYDDLSSLDPDVLSFPNVQRLGDLFP